MSEPRQLRVGYLTPDERAVMADLAKVTAGLQAIVGVEVREDLRELIHHVHVLQAFVMSQAAARAYPSEYRLLGNATPLIPTAADRD